MLTDSPHPTAPPTLEESLEHCRRITRDCARNFYYGLKLAPEPKRSALYTLYAWMRAADDLVDEANPGDPAAARDALARFLAGTNSAMAAIPPDDDSREPLWVAVHALGERYHVDRDLFAEMIEGQLLDLERSTYQTFAELRDYCYRVASTVGLLCISIWGYEGQRAPDMAIDRGIAFQLTNILRDYAEDFDRGRVYLPIEDFDRAGLTPDELRHWSKPATCRAFVSEQVKRARTYYHQSRDLDVLVSPECRPVLWAMTAIYQSILDRIGELPDRLIHGAPVRIGALRKGMIALEAKRRASHARRRGGAPGERSVPPAGQRPFPP